MFNLKWLIRRKSKSKPYRFTEDNYVIINEGVKVLLMDSLAKGRGRGNSVKWFNFERRQIVGWRHIHPKVGDIVKALMGSGRIACFQITKVDPQDNPRDMFFADMIDIGYEDFEAGI